MPIHNLTLTYSVLSTAELSTTQAELCNAARKATEQAYAPYSNFYVGASARLNSGALVSASNLENAAYPMCLCAEATLLGTLHSQHAKQQIDSIAVAVNGTRSVDAVAAPCGSCRQQLFEAENRQQAAIQLLLVGQDHVHVFNSMADLLPFGFVL